MPYEEDYKMWLEKMLIESNPDWVCDEMYDVGFAHEWCEKYCGEDSEYVTPKCLHMYYHHIARADRKTENCSEILNNCENHSGEVTEMVKDEPQRDCLTCRYNSDEWDSPKCDGCSKAHSNYEPQIEEWYTYQDEQEYNARHGKE